MRRRIRRTQMLVPEPMSSQSAKETTRWPPCHSTGRKRAASESGIRTAASDCPVPTSPRNGPKPRAFQTSELPTNCARCWTTRSARQTRSQTRTARIGSGGATLPFGLKPRPAFWRRAFGIGGSRPTSEAPTTLPQMPMEAAEQSMPVSAERARVMEEFSAWWSRLSGERVSGMAVYAIPEPSRTLSAFAG